MATATVQIPATGTYRIDPSGSSVSFTTRHLFGLGVVRGTFGVLSGEVTIADPVTASTARAVIDAASFSSGHTQRDKDAALGVALGDRGSQGRMAGRAVADIAAGGGQRGQDALVGIRQRRWWPVRGG